MTVPAHSHEGPYCVVKKYKNELKLSYDFESQKYKRSR